MSDYLPVDELLKEKMLNHDLRFSLDDYLACIVETGEQLLKSKPKKLYDAVVRLNSFGQGLKERLDESHNAIHMASSIGESLISSYHKKIQRNEKSFLSDLFSLEENGDFGCFMFMLGIGGGLGLFTGILGSLADPQASPINLTFSYLYGSIASFLFTAYIIGTTKDLADYRGCTNDIKRAISDADDLRTVLDKVHRWGIGL